MSRNAIEVGFLYAISQAATPEGRLASLMSQHLHCSIMPEELRAFILAHWSKVSMLAHQIYDEPDPYVFLQAGDG